MRKILFWVHHNSFKLAGSYMGWYWIFQFKGIDIEKNVGLNILAMVAFSFALVLFSYGVFFILKEVGKLKLKNLFIKLIHYIL